jgi:uncharacterized cupin superfamily protein
MKAYRLYTTTDGASAFQKGQIKDLQKIESDYFFFQQDPSDRRSYEWHPAPREQYVITLKGTIEFTVTDGNSFMIEPGDVLIAKDVESSGHKWKMLSEQSWTRVYIALREGEDDGFEADRTV